MSQTEVNPHHRSNPWVVPGKWTVSRYDFEPEVRQDWSLPAQVKIHDVTLRDGEQWPGVVLQKAEKLRIAHALADLGVQRIEGGMPVVCEEDVDAVRAMCREIRSAEISALVRPFQTDMELAASCGVRHVVLEVLAMPLAMQLFFGGSVEKCVEECIKLTEFAAQNGIQTTLFLSDTTRAELALLASLVEPISTQGKITSVAVVDTRGCALPQAMAWLVTSIRSMTTLPIEVHAHHDFGMATATTLAAVAAGAEVMHTAVNGLNGNAALDECVMGAEALLGVDTGVQLAGLTAISELVEEASGAGWYKPFVGPGLNRQEVGTVALPMWLYRDQGGFGQSDIFPNYQVVGGKAVELVLGKMSGKYSIAFKAWQLGLTIPSEEATTEILSQIKSISQREKRLVTEEEFRAMHETITAQMPGPPVT
jgi:isopropylmalate/homocitrate/citramalate synthase